MSKSYPTNQTELNPQGSDPLCAADKHKHRTWIPITADDLSHVPITEVEYNTMAHVCAHCGYRSECGKLALAEVDRAKEEKRSAWGIWAGYNIELDNHIAELQKEFNDE